MKTWPVKIRILKKTDLIQKSWNPDVLRGLHLLYNRPPEKVLSLKQKYVYYRWSDISLAKHFLTNLDNGCRWWRRQAQQMPGQKELLAPRYKLSRGPGFGSWSAEVGTLMDGEMRRMLS